MNIMKKVKVHATMKKKLRSLFQIQMKIQLKRNTSDFLLNFKSLF